ncbi:MAG: response regulator [Actinobacteria bacterium]|jgi:DNA-binding NarL/FixJ family response regulator|nr:response regulator [Actinomycetota bacterium]
MTLKVLVTEDHQLVSQGLEAMLNMSDEVELVGVVNTGEKAVERVANGDIEVVLMDVNLGAGMNGIEATRQIKQAYPDTRVLVLTMFTDPATVAEAVKAGADGYLSKGASKESVVQAIQDVSEGRAVLDPNVTEGIFGRISGKNVQALSDRELTVLQELSHGRSTREVAGHIHVSEETVKTYLKQIFRKLGVHDRTEAVAEAFRRGLVH